MNVSDLNINSLGRVIAHQIKAKTKKNAAETVHRKSLLTLTANEKRVLIERIENSLKKTTKSFRLEFKEKKEGSIFKLLNNSNLSQDKDFLEFSENISDKLALAHFSGNIPGGICIVGDGETDKKQQIIFVIKAELQEVFNIEVDVLKVLSNVFLSPAKDFYKIAFFVKNNKNWIPFIFDDQFTLQKEDLTEYFYCRFAGLTTDKNDAIRCKNFHQYTLEFINKKVDNLKDKIGLQSALRTYIRENVKGTVSLKEFANQHFEGSLKKEYLQLYGEKLPSSFTINLQLLENRLDLKRISIPLTYQINVIGDEKSMINVEVMDVNDKTIKEQLLPLIETGSIKRLVLLKEADDSAIESSGLI